MLRQPPNWIPFGVVVFREVEDGIPTFEADEKGMATRVSSGKVLNSLAEKFPWMLGGSADLAPSNMTNLNFEGLEILAQRIMVETPLWNSGTFNGSHLPWNVTLWIAIILCNLLCLSDYLRPALRLSSIMHQDDLYRGP